MDSIYSEFVKDGETIYPQKADSLTAYSGNYRVKVSWLLISDPSITKSKIYWNNKQDSLEVPVQRGNDIDSMSVVIENLDERIYTFQIFTYDQNGNKSVPTEVSATVYGDIYKSSLPLRLINKFSAEGDDAVIGWKTAPENLIGNEIIYSDNSGTVKKLFVSADVNTTTLSDFNFDADIQYRSLYLPNITAIDTFSTQYLAPQVVKMEKEIDKSGVKLFGLPGDYSVPHTSNHKVDNIWKNNSLVNSPTYISKVGGHVMPQWFTIDLGKAYKLTKIKLFQRGDSGSNSGWLFAGGNLREFEVWGSDNPDPNYNPDDHGGDFGSSWVLLKSCTVYRPSGDLLPTSSPRSDNTEEDIASAMIGHEFELNNSNKVRYIRIKAIQNWHHSGSAYVNIAALNLSAFQYSLVVN